MKKVLLLFGFTFFFLSCEDDCEDIACFTPPEPFSFEFVDATSGENIFTNGTFQEEDISIINQADDSNVQVDFISENDYNILQIGSIGWLSEDANYLIEVGEDISFTLLVDAKRVNQDCCSFTRINNVEIEGEEYEKDAESGLYRILTEQN
ncbi:hypothetical protein RM545_02085 [Zunongwangia sp. F260]|uniref:Lipoprotein n=1 Tax=Autumnicola lenta TaxID=3075593 RepID=A0ABU3CGR0_9FLAO|nr:hypothetical protein [Zunongwangia sp. F260]MDT0645466.1 hypothetical protein [Zunongwangia sp. F260]